MIFTSILLFVLWTFLVFLFSRWWSKPSEYELWLIQQTGYWKGYYTCAYLDYGIKEAYEPKTSKDLTQAG